MARVEDVVVRETALRTISLDLEMGENGLRVGVGMVDNWGGGIMENQGRRKRENGRPSTWVTKGRRRVECLLQVRTIDQEARKSAGCRGKKPRANEPLSPNSLPLSRQQENFVWGDFEALASCAWRSSSR